MRQSEQVGELAAALAVAQSKMEPPKKDKTAKVAMKAGGEYSYHYSDLASLIDAIRGPLAANGLAFFQSIYLDDAQLMLETRIIHASGQWIASQYPLAAYAKPQEQGSAITYARRYALGALAGLAPEDDDGKAAQEGERTEPRPAQQSQPDLIGESIEDVANAIVVIDGGNQAEIIARASAFYGKEHPRSGDDMSPRDRWHTDAPFEKDVAAIKSLSRVKSEKWKAKTLIALKQRLEALRQTPPEPPADVVTEPYQATDEDVPW